MKNLALTIALLLSYHCLLAQNWAPFTPGETHHFESDTSNFPDRSVRIDSVRMLAGDSIWHFNRLLKVLVWDTADVNAPLFCRRSVVVQPGGVFQFFDPDTLTLRTLADSGDSWLIDVTHQRLASVSRVYADTVFGSLDSLKVILIDSLDSLVLSKAHGLMAWPAVLGPQHYTKVGIQERHLGDTLPGFDAIFAHHVNNTYYWHSLVVDEVGFSTVWRWKMHIDSLHRDSSGLDVHWSGIAMGGLLISGVWEIRDSADFPIHHGHEDAISHYMCLEPYRMEYLWTNWFRVPGNSQWAWPQENWTTAVWERVQGAMVLRLGLSSDIWYSSIFYQNASPYAAGNGDDREYAIFRPGLGLTEVNWRIFEGEGFLKMVGYIVDEVVNGTIWPDSVLLENAPSSNADIQLWPNPARDFLHLHTASASGCDIAIMDLSGKSILSQHIQENEGILDLRALPAGMYLARITVAGETLTRRLVIAH